MDLSVLLTLDAGMVCNKTYCGILTSIRENSRDLIAQIIIICAQAIGVLIGVFNGTFTSAVLGLSASGFFSYSCVLGIVIFSAGITVNEVGKACSSRHGQ